MDVRAKVKGLGGYASNNRDGINILFYGVLSSGKDFELEIPYTKEGLIVEGKCDTIKRDLGEYFTPQHFIDMGKIYEKVQQVECEKIIDLIQKTTDIKNRYAKLIIGLENDKYNIEKEMDGCDKAINELQKKLRRLKKEDKKEEVQLKINDIVKGRDILFSQWNNIDEEIDNLETIKIKEVGSLEVI